MNNLNSLGDPADNDLPSGNYIEVDRDDVEANKYYVVKRANNNYKVKVTQVDEEGEIIYSIYATFNKQVGNPQWIVNDPPIDAPAYGPHSFFKRPIQDGGKKNRKSLRKNRKNKKSRKGSRRNSRR
jgi:hypothetical protein